jgi:hypothetical protein
LTSSPSLSDKAHVAEFLRILTASPLPIGQERNSDGMRRIGIAAVSGLKKDATEDPNCPVRMRQDWQSIAEWIGFEGGDLTYDQLEMIGCGWVGYVSIGLAPSHAMQSNFEAIAKSMGDLPSLRPPKQVMRVFDRLFASDEEIKEKRAADIEAERRMLEPLFKAAAASKAEAEIGRWHWHGLSRAARKWIFCCIVWLAAVYVYAYIFDPFDTGGWDGMRDEEFNRLVTVACLPIFGGVVYRAYLKWVA